MRVSWAPLLLAAAALLAARAAHAAASAAGDGAFGAAVHARAALALPWPPASLLQAIDELRMGLAPLLAVAGAKLAAADEWPRVVASVATGCAVSLGAVAATGGVEPYDASRARAFTALAVSHALGTVQRGARQLVMA